MENDMMTVLLVQPGKHPVEITIPHTLKELQKQVGGTIEIVYPWPDRSVGLVCHDEGKLLGLPLNRALPEIGDAIAGDFLLCGLCDTEDGGSLCSLPPEQKYYPHPLHEGENTVILVTDEVANALERFIREENNDTLRRYRAKAYYSLDCENGIEHHILFREKTPEELYEKKLTMQQLNRALAKLPVKQSQHIYAHFFLGKSSREIATAENVSVRAVQKSVRAGLKRLGKILKND